MIYIKGERRTIFTRLPSYNTREGRQYRYDQNARDTGTNLTPKTVNRIGEYPHIIYIKGFSETSPSFGTQEYINKYVLNDKYIRVKHWDNVEILIQVIQKGEVKSVSDASYARSRNRNVAWAAWFLETDTCKHQ